MAQKHDLDYIPILQLGNPFVEVRGILDGEDRHYHYFISEELAETFIQDFENSEAGKNSLWSNFIIIRHDMVVELK
jgi:hypothetical protein